MAAEVQASEELSYTGKLTRKQLLLVTVISAVVVALAFQGMHMARNNYSLWRYEFTGIELAVALVASFVANLFGDMDERGYAWAAGYLPARRGLAFDILAALPFSTVRAVLMTACLSIPNALIVPTVIYREEVKAPVLSVIVRFLADIPQAIILCTLVFVLVKCLSGKQLPFKVAWPFSRKD